jgi:hypothetical protein
MIAAIGPTWLTVADEQGERRLGDPADDVRRELEIALDRAVPIIPVLVEGAAAPDRDERPESLRGLVAHQAFVLRDEGWFDRVGGPLIESCRTAARGSPRVTRAGRVVAGGRVLTDGLLGLVIVGQLTPMAGLARTVERGQIPHLTTATDSPDSAPPQSSSCCAGSR